MQWSLPLVCVTLLAAPAAAQSGAIFSADKNGTLVNDNIFSSKTSVYLGGGPAGGNCGSAGLPDGDYYFQVTDPSGTVLLSEDGPGGIEERRITVTGGLIASTSGTHKAARKSGRCGSALIQLAPFADTPSSGLQYKVWVTSVADFSFGNGANGFLSKFSKTDSFKVKAKGKPSPQTVITGMKFFDHNLNGEFDNDPAAPGYDPLEVPIVGWRIELREAGALREVIFTDENGDYLFYVDQNGAQYEIAEIAPGGFIGEGVPGAKWLATTNTTGMVVADADQVPGPVFGNVSFGVTSGLALSKGFFHGPNGALLLQGCEPEWREALNGTVAEPVCLTYPSQGMTAPYYTHTVLGPTIPIGTPFQPEFDELSSFLVGATWGHAANILSTHMAATLLNRACGPFGSTTVYVDRLQNGILVSLDDMIADAMGLLCDPLAPETWVGNPNPAAQALRASILACTGEFSTLNSGTENKFTPDDDPDGFPTPYLE